MIQIDDDGYVSPIQMIMGEIKSQVEYQQGQAILKAVRNVGVNVDLPELLQALKYDRAQYSQGYHAGYKAGRADALENAVPVVHGSWVEYPECLRFYGATNIEHIVCSACHSVWDIMDNDTEKFDFCPHCGAKMDGGDADDHG